MIVCQKCNKKRSDGTKFCNGCGTQISEFETIFCPHCGKKISAEFAFCSNCGTPVTRTSTNTHTYQEGLHQTASCGNPMKQPKATQAVKKGFGRAWILGAIIVLVMVVSFFMLEKLNSVKGFPAFTNESTDAQVQGSGYDSAEEAVRAYVNALNRKDYDAMLSTFAVESYVEHYDLGAMVDRLQEYRMTYTMNITNENELARGILKTRRINEINSMIEYQYFKIIGVDELLADEGKDLMESFGLAESDFENGSELIETLFQNAKRLDSVSIEAGSRIDPTLLFERYYDARNMENIQRQKNIIGADELENICMNVTINDTLYYLFADCICFSGKWYLHSFNCNLSSALGVNPYSGGLAPVGTFSF